MTGQETIQVEFLFEYRAEDRLYEAGELARLNPWFAERLIEQGRAKKFEDPYAND